MSPLDLNHHLVVWHCTAATNVPSIRQHGLRRRSKGVYFGLHPGVALGFARSHIPQAVIATVNLKREGYRWGEALHLDRHEGLVWADLPPEVIVNLRPAADCTATPSTWLAASRPEDDPSRHPGFQPWLDDGQVAAHLAACWRRAEQDPTTALIAALYVFGLPLRPQTELRASLLTALEAALARAGQLDLEAVACGLDLRRAGDPSWMPAPNLLSGWPMPILALWMSTRLDAQGRPMPESVERLAGACGQRRCEQVLGTLAVLIGEVVPTGLDVAQIEALVTLCRFGRWGWNRQQGVCKALQAIAQADSIIADPALLFLLADLRRLPAKTRNQVSALLAPRVARLDKALHEIAQTGPWLSARAARRLLGIQTVPSDEGEGLP